MRLLILGATGPTGRHLVDQALGAGHDVTAVVREPARIPIVHPRLAIVVGDATDARTLEGAMSGKDAVLSALGAGSSLRSQIASRAMAAVIPAMRARSVKRVIFLSSFGVGESYGQTSLLQRIAFRTMLRQIFADKAKADAMLRASGLDWTLVYPTLLTNGARAGRYQVGERLAMRGMPTISRADVAAFMLAQLASDEWRCRTAVISD